MDYEHKSGVPETFIMIVHVAHEEHIFISRESHAILGIDTGFKDVLDSFHRMTSQSGMPEVGIEQAERLIHLPLYSLR
ncbi:MAG: hypothetical protein HY530_02270 [Chloroflexi bacterium]|nr:hypothetical protein [Chloroflexota bacterium]